MTWPCEFFRRRLAERLVLQHRAAACRRVLRPSKIVLESSSCGAPLRWPTAGQAGSAPARSAARPRLDSAQAAALVVTAAGAPDTNRTCDLPLRRGLLYPLSYRGAAAILRGNAGFPGRLSLSIWKRAFDSASADSGCSSRSSQCSPSKRAAPGLGLGRRHRAVRADADGDRRAHAAHGGGRRRATTLIDLGSGDGRIVIEAAKRGARGIGVDLDSQPGEVRHRERAASAGVATRARFEVARHLRDRPLAARR